MNVSLKRSLLVIAICLITLGTASASPITGSLAISGFGATLVGGSNLLTATQINVAVYIASNVGTGDLSPIGMFTGFGTAPLVLSSLGGFTLSSPYLTFVSSAVGSMIVSQTADFMDVYLMGTLTPGPLLINGPDMLPATSDDLTPNTASLRFSVNKTGSSVSEGITLASPPDILGTPVPEPTSMMLLGGAILGLSLLRRRWTT